MRCLEMFVIWCPHGTLPAWKMTMKTLTNMILAAAAAVALASTVVTGFQTVEPKPVAAFDDPVPQPNCPTWPEPCN